MIDVPEIGEIPRSQRTDFSPYEDNGHTEFASFLIDYGPRSNSLYASTQDGLSFWLVDRKNGDKITPYIPEETSPIGYVIFGSKSSGKLYLQPLGEHDIRVQDISNTLSITRAVKPTSISWKEHDIEKYAVLLINPDTQSLSVYHSCDSTSPVDFHPGSVIDPELLEEIRGINPTKFDAEPGILEGQKGQNAIETDPKEYDGFKHSPQE